jgi:hypothetical protein
MPFSVLKMIFAFFSGLDGLVEKLPRTITRMVLLYPVVYCDDAEAAWSCEQST